MEPGLDLQLEFVGVGQTLVLLLGLAPTQPPAWQLLMVLSLPLLLLHLGVLLLPLLPLQWWSWLVWRRGWWRW